MVAKWNAEMGTFLPPPAAAQGFYDGYHGTQFCSFSVENRFMNDTQPAYVVSATTSPCNCTWPVWLNVLWFSALISSLASASIGIVVKQRPRESNVGLSGTSEHVARLRQSHRLNNLIKRGVGGIVSLLLVPLQASLILFLASLLVLLWTIDIAVASVAPHSGSWN
ncbi:hypothetical protein K466DRAFT_618695 [Polyporus arcularius HHB13444]|uniref:DUF6535 domain-containing protein n=1 Tax=Polyporus arcularius HHB13444 TaxID=1314778 RepID=A0A5C3PDU7_9APHY|nr:hypothetical protein K466DRAFT_618695 [Polyporus arcularius HHB13444]